MKLPVKTRACTLLAALVSCAGFMALQQRSSAQDSPSQSLGDVARKTRQDHAAPGHVPARKLATEDLDGPDADGVWRMRLCTIQPCNELSISLPKHPKWTRVEQEPRPVLIPVAGHEDDPGRAIRVYAGQSSDPRYFADAFRRVFLQSWFGRPEYFGQSAQLLRDEHVPIDFATGIITHFTITTPLLKYGGLSVITGTNQGSFGFACVYREEDSAVGISICDAVVKSARYQELQPSTVRRVYPEDDRLNDPPEEPDPR